MYHQMMQGVCGLAFVATIIALVYTWRDYQFLRTALVSGKCRETMGRVSGFVPENADGHPRESFEVNGIRFEYSSNDVTSAYRWTAGKGGPLHEGTPIRSCDVDGRIVRLETLSVSRRQSR
jgi:hypothetical protein